MFYKKEVLVQTCNVAITLSFHTEKSFLLTKGKQSHHPCLFCSMFTNAIQMLW